MVFRLADKPVNYLSLMFMSEQKRYNGLQLISEGQFRKSDNSCASAKYIFGCYGYPSALLSFLVVEAFKKNLLSSSVDTWSHAHHRCTMMLRKEDKRGQHRLNISS